MFFDPMHVDLPIATRYFHLICPSLAALTFVATPLPLPPSCAESAPSSRARSSARAATETSAAAATKRTRSQRGGWSRRRRRKAARRHQTTSCAQVILNNLSQVFHIQHNFFRVPSRPLAVPGLPRARPAVPAPVLRPQPAAGKAQGARAVDEPSGRKIEVCQLYVFRCCCIW